MILRNDSFLWSDKQWDFPKLKQVNGESGGRYYLIPKKESENEYEGIKLFSITNVLSFDPKKQKALSEWKKRVGEKEANRICQFATGRGTGVHTLLEKYLRGHSLDSDLILPHLKEMFYSAFESLKNITKIHCLEQKMFSRNLGIAGTADGIIDWRGVPSIMDFKTSGKLKKESYIKDYFLQTCAYSVMWKELTGQQFDQVVIFILVDGEPEPQIFVDSVDKYKPLLLKRIKEFYRGRRLELPLVFSTRSDTK